MLLLRLFLLVPIIVALEMDFGTYVITITDENILETIRTTDSFTDELILSNLGLAGFAENVFHSNLSNVRILTLANNWLTTLPKYLFSNLINLEHLSLSDNNISCCLENVFSGLKNLEVLDISNNNLTEISRNYFVGLTSTINVIVNGNPISKIMESFSDFPMRPNNLRSGEKEVATNNSAEENNDFRIKVCYGSKTFHRNKVIKIVDRLNTSVLPPDCENATVYYTERKLFIPKYAMIDPAINFTGLYDLPISSIDFLSNSLLDETTIIPILNNLPANIRHVSMTVCEVINPLSMSDMKKTIIVIENKNLHSLNFRGFKLKYIAPSLFNKTMLRVLKLESAGLRELDFVKSLPSTLTELDLRNNDIDIIPAGSFVGLHQLVRLSLGGNKIFNLGSLSLRGMFALQFLDLSRMTCYLRTIERGCFRDLKKLNYLNLAFNRINIYKGLFIGLKSIEVLILERNGLSTITGDTLYALPDTLSTVRLGGNNIRRLENNSFVRVPKHSLYLNNNAISFIASECFKLPTLQELSLTNNNLSEFDSWGNLNRLKNLWLDSNQITTVKKRAMENMKQLEMLDLSKNRLRKLEKGALSGLSKSPNITVYLNGVPIQLIQGRVFYYV